MTKVILKAVKPLKNKKGISLTECIAALAIIAIISLSLATGFMAATVNTQRGRKIQDASQSVSSKVELDLNDKKNGKAKIIRFKVNGQEDAMVDGRLVTETDEETGITYTIFEGNQ